RAGAFHPQCSPSSARSARMIGPATRQTRGTRTETCPRLFPCIGVGRLIRIEWLADTALDKALYSWGEPQPVVHQFFPHRKRWCRKGRIREGADRDTVMMRKSARLPIDV